MRQRLNLVSVKADEKRGETEAKFSFGGSSHHSEWPDQFRKSKASCFELAWELKVDQNEEEPKWKPKSCECASASTLEIVASAGWR